MIYDCADWFSSDFGGTSSSDPPSCYLPQDPHSPLKRRRQQMHRKMSVTSRAKPNREPRTMPAMAPGPRMGTGREGRKGHKAAGQRLDPSFLSS